jgi:hypothetical protein
MRAISRRTAVAAAWLMLGSTWPAAGENGPHHIVYLHGRIIQETQSARPRHPEWGYYELEKILATLRERGFVVTGEIRPKDSSLDASADRVVEQVRALRASGVPPAGRVLTIRDTSDETSEPSPPWKDHATRYPLLRAREVVISTGQNHGFLYRPLPEWVSPFAAWARER